ncbi:MAG: hypothetical protein L6R43_18560 [Planctomycetes bacterium]|nr:hypothetical protein [Planctomycetota bacterium]
MRAYRLRELSVIREARRFGRPVRGALALHREKYPPPPGYHPEPEGPPVEEPPVNVNGPKRAGKEE